MTTTRELYRTESPETSRLAAESISPTHLEQLILDRIRQAGFDGMTQDELLTAFPNLSYSSVTARPAALKRKGLIIPSGRRAGSSGRSQTVLIATEFYLG